MFKILVCEDEKNIRKLMCEYLTSEHYEAIESKNGEEALHILDKMHIDLLITDVMMPQMDGYTLSEALRASGNKLPILMVTAKESIRDKRTGFNIGIDDYMVKPIDMEEMLMRVSALLRRAQSSSQKQLVVGKTRLNYENFTVTTEDEVITVPKKEFMLLYMLLSRENRIMTRQQIMDEIWGYDSESEEQTVNVHIRRLRERFEQNADFEIVTVKGLGYKAVKL